MFEFDMTFSKRVAYLDEVQKCYSQLKSPVFIMWDITNKCNFRCLHCYNSSGVDAKYADLSDAEMLSLCAQIIDVDPILVCFCGGEPLYRGDLIFELARQLYEANIRVNIVSNGSLITEKVAQKIRDAKIKSVQVSLDGANAKTNDYFRGVDGAYDLAVRGIKNLAKVGYSVPITFIPTRVNYKEFPQVLDFVYSMGCREFRMMPLLPIGRGRSNLKELELTDEDNWELTWLILKAQQEYPQCKIEWGDPVEHLYLFPGNTLSKSFTYEIRSNGDIVLSSYLPLIVGNIKEYTLKEFWEAGLSDIWRHPIVQKWVKKIVSLKDIENQEVMPWESEDILIELPALKKKNGSKGVTKDV